MQLNTETNSTINLSIFYRRKFRLLFFKEAIDTKWIASIVYDINVFETEICQLIDPGYSTTVSPETSPANLSYKLIAV